MPTTPVPGPHDSEQVAARAEARWVVFVAIVIGLLLCMIAFTSLHWVLMPSKRIETVNPSTLHLSGEFTEDNLGSALEPDGSVMVRLIGQQYSFAPQCIVVPDRTQIKFRGTSADVIHGFIITGTQPKKVIVRAIGTSLPLADKLANPILELRGPNGLIEANDNWIDSPNKQAILDSTIPPTSDLEAAIVQTLPANGTGYTAIVRGVNNTTGVGLVEVYDLDQ